MRILRNTDEWIGLLVLASIGLFIAAVLHAGLLSDWFRPTAKLRIMLPETGSQGLSSGADIQVLGTRVGTVRRVVVDPSQRMYAEAELEEQATAFIRRDSQAVVKKQFGVAGAAYLDIARGKGPGLDWNFAVIDAVTERDPTENIGAMIDQVKQKIFPILDDVARTTHALADTADGIAQGHGDIGRLVKNEDLMNQLKTATDQLNAALADVTGPEGIPALLHRADDALASVQKATHDLASATPRLPGITKDIGTSTASLPALLAQSQQAAVELEKVLDQLRHTWPLSGSATPEPRRLSPAEVRP